MIFNSPPESLISRHQITWGCAEWRLHAWPEVISTHLSLIKGKACALYKLHRDISPRFLRITSSSCPSYLWPRGSATSHLTHQIPDFSAWSLPGPNRYAPFLCSNAQHGPLFPLPPTLSSSQGPLPTSITCFS